MDLITSIFTNHPALALFCSLALGYTLGKLTFGSFTVGSVAGCLLAGVLVGQTGVVVFDDLKQNFFLLFLFSIGYRTGPQFFRSLNADALPQIVITVLLCVLALATAVVLAPLLELSVGTAAGLLAGGATESATLGVAIDAFAKTGASVEEQKVFSAEIATGFAVAYFTGAIATIVLHTQVIPRFLQAVTGGSLQGIRSGSSLPVLRGVKLHRGDVLTVSGTRSHIEDIENIVGYIDGRSEKTDMAYVAFFVLLGG